MVYTVTFNPSLDYVVKVDSLCLGRTNRTSEDQMVPGGKGINVSAVLNHLGMESVVLGFIAGFTGEEIRCQIRQMSLRENLIMLPDQAGNSRINIKLHAEQETEINGCGPQVSSVDVDQLYKKLDRMNSGDALVLSGSMVSSLPDTMYRDMIARYSEKDILIAVDASGNLLQQTLSFRPFVIKPNQQELSEFFGVEIETAQDSIYYAKKLQEQGARNVIVSLGAAGAVLVTEDQDILRCGPLPGEVITTTGAGDSMIAGFLYGYMTCGDYRQAFSYGISCGSATAFSNHLAEREEVELLLKLSESMIS